MNTTWTTIQNALWNLIHRPGLTDILDIFIVAFILYKLLVMMRQTRSSGAMKGLFLFLLATGISNLLGLTALNWMLMAIIKNGVLVLVILFQPELRTALQQVPTDAKNAYTTVLRNRCNDVVNRFNDIRFNGISEVRSAVNACISDITEYYSEYGSGAFNLELSSLNSIKQELNNPDSWVHRVYY